ncbi:hypothetical protein HF1_06060 [Mycoplasma haemofelis str. Langford 1]|uniref:Uncharacterized protein n=1 Tax=Mycoplasma haemofelis (strain Langford 1) TaxID=941640 RepID=E8ZHJ3_MYCHL|nr:hypothetical protein [Mycoplasma haemofelis]CBY92614.1 hypothetical protein HF1_06060 [Mycoplasma haemofelis str. Langford 1]
MKFVGVKFLAGGATAASATGLGALGVSSIDWKEKPKELTKTKNEDTPVTPKKEKAESPDTPTASPSQPEAQSQASVTCTVFKIDNKGQAGQQITEIKDWEKKRKDDQNKETTNKNFWTDVESACTGTNTNKPWWNGKVYVTETGGKWNYSRDDQKDWTRSSR